MKPIVIIENVNLVVGLSHNLLSVAQLFSKCYNVVFIRDIVFIMQGDETLFKESSINNIYTINLFDANNL